MQERWGKIAKAKKKASKRVVVKAKKAAKKINEVKRTFPGAIIQEIQEQNADAKPYRIKSEESEDNNMKFSEMYPSNYFSKEDLTASLVLTIKQVILEAVESEEGKREKPIVYFHGNWKPFILNKTNGEILRSEFGDESDNWIDKEVELYVDHNIRFGSKRIGGIRVRVPNTSETETTV